MSEADMKLSAASFEDIFLELNRRYGSFLIGGGDPKFPLPGEQEPRGLLLSGVNPLRFMQKLIPFLGSRLVKIIEEAKEGGQMPKDYDPQAVLDALMRVGDLLRKRPKIVRTDESGEDE